MFIDSPTFSKKMQFQKYQRQPFYFYFKNNTLQYYDNKDFMRFLQRSEQCLFIKSFYDGWLLQCYFCTVIKTCLIFRLWTKIKK